VLDADWLGLAVVVPLPTRQVAGGRHPVCCHQLRVALHAVAERQARSLEPFDVGHHADADHHDIGVETPTVVQRDGDPPRAVGRAVRSVVAFGDSRDPGGGPQIDTVLGVQPRARATDLLAECRCEGRAECLQHRHRAPEVGAGRRDLRADESRSDDHHAASGPGVGHPGPERDRVVECPERPHVGDRLGARKAPRPGAGRH